MSRIKLQDAIKYLGLSRDSFWEWCSSVRIATYTYEFSNRQYLLKGEFYARADAKLIERLQEIHGDNWGKYYDHYYEVIAFLDRDNKLKKTLIPLQTPKYSDTNSFLNRLRK